MAGKSRTMQLAKLSRPRLFDALPRERLFAILDAASQHPSLWIAAPPGAGKTTLVGGWLESRGKSGIWYQVDSGDADAASFFISWAWPSVRDRGGRALCGRFPC